MIASKVTISQETREKLDNPTLSWEKKQMLRDELVKDYIRSLEGRQVMKVALVAAAGYAADTKSSGYAAGLNFVNGMIKRGIICHEITDKMQKIWTVIEDVKKHQLEPPVVTPSMVEVAEEAIAHAEAVKAEPVKEAIVELKEFPALTSVKLVDMAKEFAWRNNSDSLREFISYIENAIK